MHLSVKRSMQLGREICLISSLCSTNSTLSALELKLNLLQDLFLLLLLLLLLLPLQPYPCFGILHQIIPSFAILDELAPISQF
jgi:hypothetical protein